MFNKLQIHRFIIKELRINRYSDFVKKMVAVSEKIIKLKIAE
jgi:hypothetical protein